MKRKLIWHSFLLFIAASQVEAQVDSTWALLPEAPEHGYRHEDIHFSDPDNGWLVSGTKDDGFGRIYMTKDGGETWELSMARQGTYFRSVGFATDSLGWAGNLGPINWAEVSDTNLLYQTNDGGKTWQVVENIEGPRPSGICGISVVNDSVVYASGRVLGPSYLLKTSDAGEHWTSIDLNQMAGMLTDCYFWSSDSGIVIGGSANSYPESRGVVLLTTDGGVTWKNVCTTDHIGGTCWKISFPSKEVGYISYETLDSRVIFLKTVDRGVTWQELPFLESSFRAQGIGFIDENTGWIGSHSEKLAYQTTDGGKTWKPGFIGANVNRIRIIEGVAYATGLSVFRLR